MNNCEDENLGRTLQNWPQFQEFHPCLLHLSRKAPHGKNRQKEKETVPNVHHSKLELFVRKNADGKRKVIVKNKTSQRDQGRVPPIPPDDELFDLKDDKLTLGNGKDNLNLTIIKPKTDKRAGATDISLSQVIQTRVNVPEAQEVIRKLFEKTGTELKSRVHLLVEIFDAKTNAPLCREKSPAILDVSSPTLAPPDMKEVKPRVSCQHGGREILIVTVHPIKNVVPIFQLYDAPSGEQILDDSIVKLLNQPKAIPDKDQRMIKFLSPEQPHLKELIQDNRVIKLALQSTTEKGLESTDPVEFKYQPQDAFLLDGACFLCQTSLMDGGPGVKSSLPPKTAPGAKRRRLSTRNSPPLGSQIVSSYPVLDLELLQHQPQEFAGANEQQNIFNVMVDVAPPAIQTSPSVNMEKEWSLSLNTPEMEEMEEQVDSPEACEEETSRRDKLSLHIDRIETSSSLNTPEVPTLGEGEMQFPFPGEKPPAEIFQSQSHDNCEELNVFIGGIEKPPENIFQRQATADSPEEIFQTDGANPRMTLRETMVEETRVEKQTENIQDFLVRCLFGNDKEAAEMFSSRRRGKYGAMEKIAFFFKHYPSFPTLLIIVLAMFIFFPITFQLVGLIFLAIVTSLCVTVYQNVTK